MRNRRGRCGSRRLTMADELERENREHREPETLRADLTATSAHKHNMY